MVERQYWWGDRVRHRGTGWWVPWLNYRGDFFRGLDLNRYIPLAGYELMAYVGAASGAILGSVLGAKHALKNEDEST